MNFVGDRETHEKIIFLWVADHSATALSSKKMRIACDIIQDYMNNEHFPGEMNPTSEFIPTWIDTARNNIDCRIRNE